MTGDKLIVSDNEWSSSRCGDRLAIQDVLSRYCRAVDRIQLEALANVFHADGKIDNGVSPINVDTFVANVGRRHPSVPAAFHTVMNVLVDFLGPHRAFVESYIMAFEQHPGKDVDAPRINRLSRIRNGDLFERRGGEWRIAHRMTVSDVVSVVPVDPMAIDPLAAAASSNRYTGIRGRCDPIVAARIALGISIE